MGPEPTWKRRDGTFVKLSGMETSYIHSLLNMFARYSMPSRLSIQWVPLLEAELALRQRATNAARIQRSYASTAQSRIPVYTDQQLNLAVTANYLDQLIKKREVEEREKFFTTAPTGWRGFYLTYRTIERVIETRGTHEIIERFEGAGLQGALGEQTDTYWPTGKMEAWCAEGKARYSSYTRDRCLLHIEASKGQSPFDGCHCGLYMYFAPSRISAGFDAFNVIAKCTGWGTIAFAKDGARCSDMRLDCLYIIRDSFPFLVNRLVANYFNFNALAKELSEVYDVPVLVVNNVKEVISSH